MTPLNNSDAGFVRRIASFRRDDNSPKAKYLDVQRLDGLEGRPAFSRKETLNARGIIGLFADEADEIDEMVQQAYQDRTSPRWERVAREDLA